MTKALVFDCFGVFYVDPVFAYMRNLHSPKDKAKTLHDLDEQAARGRLSKANFITQASELLNLSSQETDDRFFQGHDRNDELVAYVQELRKHYKIALLSNIGADMMDGFFTQQERNELFDTVVLSGSTGYAKPDLEIFKLTCGRLGVEPNGAVMIDDVQSNCDGAKAIGMQAVQYQSFRQMKQELESILHE